MRSTTTGRSETGHAGLLKKGDRFVISFPVAMTARRAHLLRSVAVAPLSVLALSLCFLPVTAGAQVQGVGVADAGTEQPAASSMDEEYDEEDIVVTGQAPPGAVIGDIPPENQLNPADIASYGVSSVSELLDEITEQTQSGQGRGSGPVILVNGKRISGVNEVGDLPTEAILRVDILPEEVALKYGYGATQKVVNIILRRRFRSVVADIRGEMATEGQGEESRGQFTYTRIQNNDRLNISARVKTEASLLESERGILPADRSATDPTGTFGDETRYRTLKPKSREYSLNGVYSHALSQKVTAVLNARAAYSTGKDREGFASDQLTIPASNPFAQSASEEVLDRYLSDRVLMQNSTTAQMHGGVSVNATLPKDWQLSFIGNYDHSDSRTGTDRGYDITDIQTAITSGDPAVNPYGILPSSLLGDVLRDRAVSQSDTGEASMVAMGKLFRVPAGDVRTSLRFGGSVSAIDSEVTRSGLVTSSSDMSRSEFNTQGSLDIPLASRKSGFLGALGTLTANLNASATRISDFGTLGAFGYGLNWSPTNWISLIASVNEDRSAPTLAQLNSPMVVTENVRVYDYVRGETVAVTRISGGNAALDGDDRHVFKLGATIKPASRLTLTANYINSRTDDALGSLPSITAAIEAAFPDRYVRNSAGTLIQVDNRPLNLAREEQEQVRWGITFTKVLREPKRAARPSRTAEGAGADGQRWRAGRGGDSEGGEGGAGGSMPRPGDGADTPPDDPDIIVNGDRDDSGPPPPDGFGARDGRRDGMGRPDDGMGRSPGGFGAGSRGGDGPGGFGGGRRRSGFGGGGNGANLQFSLFHNWYLRDRILLSEGGPSIDLLNGGSSGDGGGQPRHVVQFNGGITDNGLGLRLSADWRSATSVTADESSSSSDLHFSSLLTMDLRFFANLSNRLPNQDWAKGMRVSLNVENLFNQRQTVTDESGATPLAYQKAYLDPVGRTISLSIRKTF
ncbi:MAG: TonB-dependent receptor [Sphingobium sp.]